MTETVGWRQALPGDSSAHLIIVISLLSPSVCIGLHLETCTWDKMHMQLLLLSSPVLQRSEVPRAHFMCFSVAGARYYKRDLVLLVF